MTKLARKTKKRISNVLRGTVSTVTSFALVFSSTIAAYGQQVILDPSAPGTGFLNTDTLTPQINIATPQSGVSLNQYQSFNVDENGLILNNSATPGVSQLGANVTGNPNLIVSGPADVIVNEVTGGGTTSLTGTTEVFGQEAAVIIANPNGLSCNGCDFINNVSTTLTTGSPTINGANVSLSVSEGTITIGPDGLAVEQTGGLIGRHIVIDGPVETEAWAKSNRLKIVGGSSQVELNTDDVYNSEVYAAPILNPKETPFAIDTTSDGTLWAGFIDVESTESGLGVNLYGRPHARRIYAKSAADLFIASARGKWHVELSAIENVRQYGDISTDGNIIIRGKSYTLYQDRVLVADGEIDIATDDFVVIAGEVSGEDIAIDVTNGSFTNTGFVLASGDLTVIAGEDALQQRGIATEYDTYFDPALQNYIEAYQAQLLAGGETAEMAAEMLERAANHDVVREYVESGASMSGTDVTVTAGDELRNTGGAIAATNDIALTAGASIINEYLALERLLSDDEGCPNEDCGYATSFFAGEILAGNDLTLDAGADIHNLASTLAAANSVTATAGGDIVNALTHSSYIYEKALTGELGDDGTCDLITGFLSRACSSFGLRSLLELPFQSGGSGATETTTVVVLAPALIASLYGDIALEAAGDFDSVGSEVSAGSDLSITAGGEVYLGSIVDVEGVDVGEGGSSNQSDLINALLSGGSSGFLSLFGLDEDDPEVELTYHLTTATTNLIGRNISIQSGGNIVMTGARLMAEGDLSLVAETGSVLIDSTDLPNEIPLPTEAASFVELQPDVIGQIFGSADYFQTPPSTYTEIYNSVLADTGVTESIRQDLIDALAAEILAEVAARVAEIRVPEDMDDDDFWEDWIEDNYPWIGNFDSDDEDWPPSYTDILQAILDNDETLERLTLSAYYQIAGSLYDQFSEETGHVDTSEGGLYKLLGDLLGAEDGPENLDAIASGLIDEIGDALEVQLAAEQNAEAPVYYEGYETGVWRWAGLNQVMQALNDRLPAVGADDSEFHTYDRLQLDDAFLSDLIMATLNVTATNQGFDPLFETDPETGEFIDPGYDFSFFTENEDIQRIIIETGRLLRSNQETGALSFEDLRQAILDDGTDRDTNQYGVLPDLLVKLQTMLREEGGDVIAQHLARVSADHVSELDLTGIGTDTDIQTASEILVTTLADDLGEQALTEVETRIATNTSNYLQMLTRLEALTAVEALRRADSGADIKDAVRSVGLQSFETLFQGMDEATLQQQLADASAAIHDTYSTDLAAVNATAWQQFADIQNEIATLEQSLIDLGSSVNDGTMQVLQDELGGIQSAHVDDVASENASYDSERADLIAYWDDVIEDSMTFGILCGNACQAAQQQKQAALDALYADHQTALSDLAASAGLARLAVLQSYNLGLLSDQVADLEAANADDVADAIDQYESDVASTTEYWDEQIDFLGGIFGNCSSFCQQAEEEKQDALDALAADHTANLATIAATFDAALVDLFNQFNPDAIAAQIAGLETQYTDTTATYHADQAAVYTTLTDQLTALNQTIADLTDFQALLDELGADAVAEGTAVEGASSLSAALTGQALPQLGQEGQLLTLPDGLVVNLSEGQAETALEFIARGVEIENLSQAIADGDAAVAELAETALQAAETEYQAATGAAADAYAADRDEAVAYWDQVIADSTTIFFGGLELCGDDCEDAKDDKADALAALDADYQQELVDLETGFLQTQTDIQFNYAPENVQSYLVSLETEQGAAPDYSAQALISTDIAEQDAFIEATAWRFSLEGGMTALNRTPRSIAYAGNDLSVVSGEDVYIEGATTLAAGEDLSIIAERRIGLLAAINTEFRLTENSYEAFSVIGDTLELGALMRDPYSSETEGSDSNADDAGSLEFAQRTKKYQLSSTVLTSGGDLVLAANGENGEILNYGGSILAGENLIASATTSIENRALRNNFTLTRADGCGYNACGNTGHDYRAAEMLAGSGMILTAGEDILNRGAIMSAAGSLMASAEGDIINEAITSQYLYYYRNSSSFFGLSRKKKKLYRAAISEGVMSTEYGDLILEAGADILNDGSVFSAGGAVNLTAGGDINLLSRSEELRNYYKRRGFSGLSYGQTTNKWNEFSTALATVEGSDIYMTAEGNITGMGTVLMAYNDIDLVAGDTLTFDAHQNTRYSYTSGWSIGISFGGSGLIQAILGQGDVLEAYMATNPSLAAVHQLATSEGKWDNINGALALGYHLPALGQDINLGARGVPTISDSLAASLQKTLNPFDWTKNNALFNSIKQGSLVSENFKDYLSGIEIRLGFFSSKSEWTESYFSKIIAGNDLWLDAEKDVALVGGTSASAQNNALIYAGENVLMTALADKSWSESSSWGVSVGFSPEGTSFGFDYSGSSANGKLYTNAVLTAGNDLDIISGADTTLMGANVQARNVYMDVGGNLTLASQQNENHSDSFGFNFSISPAGPSGGVSFAEGDRVYTDNVASIIASDRLAIYVGDTTYLLGATLSSKIGNLELDTGTLVFDNYEDSDTSVSVGINGNFTDTTDWDLAPSVGYSNTQGITHATIGAGTITLRDWEDYDLSKLNRDIDNVQEVISSQSFHIAIPGVNLKRWSAQVADSLNLIEALTADIPDQIRAQGNQAIDLYQDAILNGLTPAEVAAYAASSDFQKFLNRRLSLDAAINSGNLSAAELARAMYLIGQDEKLYLDKSDGLLKVQTTCNTSSEICGVPVSELENLTESQVSEFINDSLYTLGLDVVTTEEYISAAQLAISCAMYWHIANEGQGGNSGAYLKQVVFSVPYTPEMSRALGLQPSALYLFRMALSEPGSQEYEDAQAFLTAHDGYFDDPNSVGYSQRFPHDYNNKKVAYEYISKMMNGETLSDYELGLILYTGSYIDQNLWTGVQTVAAVVELIGGLTSIARMRVTLRNSPSRPPSVDDLNQIRSRNNLTDADTVAAGRTDIPGLEDITFEGMSPGLRREAGLPSLDDLYGADRPIKSPRTNAQFTRHAEEDIFNSLSNQIDDLGLSNAQLNGRTVNVHISNQSGVCSACYQGLTNPGVPAGVVKQFSERYPTLTIRITAENGNAWAGSPVLTVRNGVVVGN